MRTTSLTVLGTLLLTGAPLFAADPAPKVTFQDHVLPIFRNACLNCHNADKKKAGLDLSSYQATITGSDGQKVIAPGDPDSSFLYKTVAHLEEPKMPQRADKLPQKDLDLIKNWIAGGALENSGSTAAAAAKPKLSLAVEASSAGKPKGPAAYPKNLPLDPVVVTRRPGAITAMAASPWAPIVALSSQKQVLLYDTASLDLIGVLPFPEGLPDVIRFSRNGALLAVGGGQGAKLGKVVLFDVITGKRISEIGEEFDAVLAADISADQAHVALGGPSRMLKIHNTADGSVMKSIKKHTDWVTAIAFSPDGKYLASADRAGNLVVWDMPGANELHALSGHKAGITEVAFRGDSAVLASVSEDGTLKLWDMAEGKQLKSVTAHGPGALSVSFTHDGKLITTGRDKVAKTWNADATPLKTTEAFPDIALRAVYDHEGKRLIAGDFSGQVRVFNATDAKPIGALDANPPKVADRIAQIEKQMKDLKAQADKSAAELKAATEALNKVKATSDQAAAALQTAQSQLAKLKSPTTQPTQSAQAK